MNNLSPSAYEREMRHFAENYRYINSLNFTGMPPRLAKAGLVLREKMTAQMRRIKQAGDIADTSKQIEQQGVGAFWLPFMAGAAGISYLLQSGNDESDKFIAQKSVIENLIASGVEPEKAAKIVMGNDPWPWWKTSAVTIISGATIFGVVKAWQKIKRA